MAARPNLAERMRLLPRVLLTSLLPAILSFLGLTAVIVGILAMHVWMGGQGTTSHHAAAPVSGTQSGGSSDTHPAAPMAAGRMSADEPAGGALEAIAASSSDHIRAEGAAQVLPAMTALASGSLEQGMPAGCGGDCSDEMALSMCVLALVLIGVAGFLSPAGRALISTLVRRGPPTTYWVSRPAPAPSLTHLCISRT